MASNKYNVNSKQNKKIIYVILFIAEIEMLFFSGIFYGLNSLVPTLKNQSYFLSLCNQKGSNFTGTCTQQNQFFGYSFITGVASCNVFALLIGIFFDKFGYKSLKIFAAITMLVACILFAISSVTIDYLIFPAMSFLGFGAQMLCVSNFPLGNLIPKYQNLFVALFSGSFDSSVAIFIFISLGYNAGISLLTSFLIIGGFAFVLIIIDAFLLMGKVDRMKSEIISLEMENKEKCITDDNEIPEIKDITTVLFTEKSSMFPNIKSVLSSRYYLLQLMFMVILFFRFTFYMSQMSLQLSLNFPSTPKTVSNYLFISSFFFVNGIVVGIVTGTIVDVIKNKFKDVSDSKKFYKSIMSSYGIPLLICYIMNELMSIFITIAQDWAVYVAFVALTIMRSFLFALNSAYVVQAFPDEFFGMAFGIILTCCGLVSFIQFPLLFNDLPSLNNVNYALIAITAITIVHPILLLIKY